VDAGPVIFFAAMLAVLWFILIRPQRRRQAAHRSMVSGLNPGDELITVGGVFGKVRSIADDHLVLEIAPGTEIRLAKEAVATVVPKEEPTAPPPENPPLT
jgi:preprotein translocase subunit YajC